MPTCTRLLTKDILPSNVYSDNFHGKKSFNSAQNCQEILLSRQKETGSGGEEMGHVEPAYTGGNAHIQQLWKTLAGPERVNTEPP